MDDSKLLIDRLWTSIEEESQKDIKAMKLQSSKKEIDQDRLRGLDNDEVEQQYEDLEALKQGADDDMETVQNDDSDEEEMQRIIRESKTYEDEEEESKDDNDDDEDMDDDEEDGENDKDHDNDDEE